MLAILLWELYGKFPEVFTHNMTTMRALQSEILTLADIGSPTETATRRIIFPCLRDLKTNLDRAVEDWGGDIRLGSLDMGLQFLKSLRDGMTGLRQDHERFSTVDNLKLSA
jgi:hypothetical protein